MVQSRRHFTDEFKREAVRYEWLSQYHWQDRNRVQRVATDWMWPRVSQKTFPVQAPWNGAFREDWIVANGRNRVSGRSGKAMKP